MQITSIFMEKTTFNHLNLMMHLKYGTTVCLTITNDVIQKFVMIIIYQKQKYSKHAKQESIILGYKKKTIHATSRSSYKMNSQFYRRYTSIHPTNSKKKKQYLQPTLQLTSTQTTLISTKSELATILTDKYQMFPLQETV